MAIIVWGKLLLQFTELTGAEINLPLSSVPKVSAVFIKKYAFSREWLKLVHYKKNISGGYKSQVDSPRFFLSSKGKENPFAELKATIEYFSSKKIFMLNRFPARFKFIEKILKLKADYTYCKELNDYLKKVSSNSIAVVFSSYYINNPASIFGHSFLKLNSKKSDILEYGINFAVDIGTDGSFAYIFKGLTGGYKGEYSVVPYYDKIREYNDFENRDLWIYYLNLSRDELDTLVKHLWELIHAGYDYYFLSENCAYHVLSAIEASKPEYDLTCDTKSIVIPVDTLKILKSYKGLVKNIEYRPSLRNIFFKQYQKLNDKEKKIFLEIVSNSDFNNFEKLNDNILSALIDYYNFRFPSFLLEDENNVYHKKIFKLKKLLLIEKSKRKLVKVAEQSESYTPFQPHEIHGTNRITLYGGYDFDINRKYIMPEFRWLYHDLNDSIKGYPLNTEIEVFKFSGKFYLENNLVNEFDVNELCLLKITSLSDFDFYQKGPSWSLYAGAIRTIDARSNNKKGVLVPTIALGMGLSKIIVGDYFLESYPSLLVYGLLMGYGSYSNSLNEQPASFGLGPRVGFKYVVTEDITLTVNYNYIKYIKFCDDSNISVIGRYQVFTDFSIDLSFLKSTENKQIKTGLMFYY